MAPINYNINALTKKYFYALDLPVTAYRRGINRRQRVAIIKNRPQTATKTETDNEIRRPALIIQRRNTETQADIEIRRSALIIQQCNTENKRPDPIEAEMVSIPSFVQTGPNEGTSSTTSEANHTNTEIINENGNSLNTIDQINNVASTSINETNKENEQESKF